MGEKTKVCLNWLPFQKLVSILSYTNQVSYNRSSWIKLREGSKEAGKTRHYFCSILVSPLHWHHSRGGLCPVLRKSLRSGPQLRKVLPTQLWKGGKDDHYLQALIWNHEPALFHDFKQLTLNGQISFLLSTAFKFPLLGKQWRPATHGETSSCPRLCQVTAGRKPCWAVWTMSASGQWVFDLHIPEVMCAAL